MSLYKGTYFKGLSREYLQFIHDTYVDINTRMRGRLALSQWDCYIMGGILSRTHRCLQNRPDHGYLETGTYYGGSAIFAAIVLDKLKKCQQSIVTMDLMEGYYGHFGASTPVTEETFWKNVELCGVQNPARIKLIIGDSGSKESYEQTKDYKFHAFLIDGDHTYTGVKRDWDRYNGLVVQDGYVMFHDYRKEPIHKGHRQYAKLRPSGRDYGVGPFVDENITHLTAWHSYGDAEPANMFVVRRL